MRIRISSTTLLVSCLVASGSGQSLYNNAETGGLTGEGLITRARPEGGFYSEVQFGNGGAGSSFRRTSFWLADDFQVINARWRVREITVWGFQDNLHYPSVNQGFVEIRRQNFDGPTVANGTFAAVEMTEIYRIFNNQPSNMYQCQKIKFNLDKILGPGKYWIVFGALGVVNVNGPWSPYLTPIGELTVPGANAMVRIGTGTAIYWRQIYDAGSLLNLDLPFWIDGEKLPLLAPRGEKIDPHPPTPDPVAVLMRLG